MKFLDDLLYIVNETLNEGKKIFLRNKPKVFMIGGMTLSAAGTVSACAATYKHVDRILDATKQKMADAETSENPGKEKAKAVGYCVGEFAKAFALPAGMIIAGNAGIGYANQLHEEHEAFLSEKVVEIGAAYTALKNRMEEKLGKEAADDIRLGVEEVTVTTEEEVNGKKKTKEETTKVADADKALQASLLSKFFDSSSSCFEKGQNQYNISFLVKIIESQQYLLDNKLVDAITWAEILNLLDIQRDSVSLTAGWLPGDTIDLGLFNGKSEATRRFINGLEEDAILLEPSCRFDISEYLDDRYITKK